MNSVKLLLFSSLMALLSVSSFSQEAKHSFTVQNGNFVYDGKPVQIHSGEIHPARIGRAHV